MARVKDTKEDECNPWGPAASTVTATLGGEGVAVAAAVTALSVEKLLVKCHQGREGLQLCSGMGRGGEYSPCLPFFLSSHLSQVPPSGRA